MSGESFLGRWSRRKQAAPETVEAEDARIACEQAEAQAALSPPAAGAASPSTAAPPELPPVESLTRDADFSAFMKPEVPPQLKNAALKKLFSDPHFNVMDGLDTYIDDYTHSEPIPEAMLRSLVQSRALKLFDYSKEEAEEAAEKLAREQAGKGAAQACAALPTEPGGAAPLPQAGPAAPLAAHEPREADPSAVRAPDPDAAPH